MKLITTTILALISLLSFAAQDKKTVKPKTPAQIIQEKLNAIDEKMKKENCISNFSCWNGYFYRKWNTCPSGPLSQDKLDAISDRYIELIEEKLKIAPNSIPVKLEYIEALMFRNFYPKALAVCNDVVLSLSKEKRPNGRYVAAAKYRLAEIQFATGDKEAALKTLKSLIDAKINTSHRYQVNWSALANCAYQFLSGATPCALNLPVWSGAKAYPEPQISTYTEKFAPLTSVKIKLNNLCPKDARVNLLVRKLKARGINASIDSKGEYEITLSLDNNAKVDKSEGYTLDISEKSAIVKARDLQGILWGVVSFVQCLSNTEKSVRICSIEDWPSTSWRGYESVPLWAHTTEYTIFSKLNYAVIQRYPMDYGNDSPLNVFQCESLAKEFKDFGLRLCFGISNHTMGLNWPYLSEPIVNMHIDRCSTFAKMGANVYYPNDDSRYPAHPDDLKKGLRPSDFDAKHVDKVFRAVKAKYPHFKMIYCPPFYWGPDSSAPYPDDREKYLKSMRIFHEEIDIFWTGGQVKGYNKSKRQVDWFKNLTGQKPAIGQNGTGPHNLLTYIVDETDWNGWHYPGFFENDIKAFLKNSHLPIECPQLSTLGDCLWNPKGYDKKRSVQNAVAQLLGKDMYSILKPGRDALTYFDKYKYGQVTADILFEDINDLRKKHEIASNSWEQAIKYNPQVRAYGHFGSAVSFVAKAVKSAANPPDFMKKFAQYTGPAREVAEKETNFDKTKGDMLFLPTDMTGPFNTYYNHKSLKDHRFIKCIRAKDTQFSETQLSFECDPFPPAGDYELIICALDDEVKGFNPMEISVNDTVFYSDVPEFAEHGYSIKKFRIPATLMKRYNKLKIKNTASGANSNGPPYFAIAYVVIKKTGEK